MSTNPVIAPPAAPPTSPTGGGGGGPHELPGTVQVTRNVPPKRVMVLPNQTVVFLGQPYASGETFIMPGPEADALVFQGHVVIVSHEEIKAWNGAEGDAIRKRAAQFIENSHVAVHATSALKEYLDGKISAADMDGVVKKARSSAPDMTHDHGFGKYTHADPDRPIPVDLTGHRQQLAQTHMLEDRQMTDEEGEGKAPGSSNPKEAS